MTFFFLVVGLEAKRELDMGQLRERRRIAIPLVAAVGGHGAAGPDLPGVQRRRLRGARLGSRHVDRHRLRARRARAGGSRRHAPARPPADARGRRRPRRAAGDRHGVHGASSRSFRSPIAVGLFGMLLALRYAPIAWRGQAAVLLGVAIWVALFESGIDPVITGLAVGLVTSAYPPARTRPRAGDGADALLPRAAHARARALGAAERCVRDLRERAASVPAPPLDELRDRAAVRARERRHPHGRAAARRRRHVSRSRWESCSATWSASRSGSSARRGSRRGSAGCAGR